VTGRAWSRAEWVAFVRAHHPDVGGNAAVFRAGLAEYRRVRAESGPADEAGQDEQGGQDAGQDDDRFDGPVEVVARPPLARRLLTRARARGRRRQIRVD
jgi:hypothetical protein